jgi:hypothetical protein
MPSPEILYVAALVWIQLDEEPLIEVAGSRLDSLSQSQRRLWWRCRTNWFSISTGGPGNIRVLEQIN